MTLTDWVQAFALVLAAAAASWLVTGVVAQAEGIAFASGPAGLAFFSAALFGVAILVERKSGGDR